MPRHYEDFTGKVVNGIKVIGLVLDSGGAGKHKRWKCECPVCHDEFVTQSNHLKTNKTSMCSNCSRLSREDLTGRRFGRLVVTSMVFPGIYQRTRCLCTCDCGSTNVDVQTNNLKAGYIKSCGCMKSYPEDFIAATLTENNVCFIKQMRFPDLKYINPLRCDFYIPDRNLVIEYNGEQHYRAVPGWGGEDALKKIQIRDEIKKNYCIEHNINYMVIRYDEDIEEALLKNNIIMKR